MAGCIDVEQTLHLKGDGSGEFDVRYGMKSADLAQMEQLSKMAEQIEGVTDSADNASPFEFTEADIRRDFAEYDEFGVRLKDVDIVETNGWKFVNLAIHFDSLDGLLRTDFLGDRSLTLTKTGTDTYELRHAAPVEHIEPGQIDGIDAASLNEMMAGMMKGFRAVLHVDVPGEIKDTNADSHTGSTATWSFDLDKDSNALVRAQSQDMRITFTGKDLSLPVIGGP